MHDEDETFEDEPVHGEDGFIYSTGPLGAGTAASLGGKSLGAFPDEDAAHRAILHEMDRQDFWPNIWQMSDHGNAHLLTTPPEGFRPSSAER